MTTSWIDRFTRSFFWFGFVVFLSASIPHIAAYYRHFDPNATDFTDTAAWVIGYLIAIVIDVADELEQVAMQQARIDAVKKAQNDSKVGGIIDTIGQAKERAKQLFGKDQSVNNGFPADTLDEPEDLHEGRTTDPLKSDEDVEEMIEDVYTPLPVASEQESEQVSEQVYSTAEMPVVNIKRSHTKPTSLTAVKQNKIKKLLSRYPDASLSVIAQKADVSRSYVSQIRKELSSIQ